MTTEELIEELRRRKKELGYTYEKISRLSGISLPTVQKVLGGFTKSPRHDTMLAIERVLRQDNQINQDNQDKAYEDMSDDMLDHMRGHIRDHRNEIDYRAPYSDCGILTGEAPAPYHAEKAGASAGTGQTAVARGTETESGPFPYVGSYPLLPHKRQGEYTAADRESLPGDVRTELIDGVIYDMSSPKTGHQIIVGDLFTQISVQIEKCGRDCLAFVSPSDVWLTGDDKNIFQPDIYVICDYSMIGSNGYTIGAPPLVIEVLSPSTRSRDLLLKAYKYHRAGVKEYWIVDPEMSHVLVYDYGKHPDGTVYDQYTFDDDISIGISGGHCAVNLRHTKETLARIAP